MPQIDHLVQARAKEVRRAHRQIPQKSGHWNIVLRGSQEQDSNRKVSAQAARRCFAGPTKYDAGADLARMDWMIAVDMAKAGRFTQQDIERGIARGTPNVQSRKAVHIEDYARRTAQKAWGAPEVVRQRQERQRGLQQEAQRDRGMER